MNRFFKMQADWAGVSLERATGHVPDDGRFHVVVQGVIVKSTRSLNAALKAYREAINASEKKPPQSGEKQTPQDIVRREADEIEFYRSALYWSYSHNYARGGKLQNRH